MSAYRFLKLDPLEPYIERRLELYRDPVNVSNLSVWVKLTAGAGVEDETGGLTIVSNPLIPTFGERSIHGSLTSEAPIGIQNFSGDPVGDYVGTGETGNGYRPRPIIEQIQITNGSRGLSRKAEFNIKCYTREQVELITQYFLEPGFTVVLEWGWNLSNSYQQVATTAEELADLSDFDKLDAKRRASEGTYDAYFGIIVGGGIDQSDNAFNVSVELAGIGETFSYLQSHQNSSTGTIPNEEEDLNESSDVGNIEIQVDKTIEDAQHESFAFMFNSLPEKLKTPRVADLRNDPRLANPNNFINFLPKVFEAVSAESSAAGIWGSFTRAIGLSDAGTVETDEGRVTIPSGEGVIDEDRFIRFGVLMEILNAGSYDLDEGVQLKGNNNNVPIKINTRNVPIDAFENMFSTDGSKLFIPNEKLPDFGLSESFSSINKHIYFKALYNQIPARYNPSFTNKSDPPNFFKEFPRKLPLRDVITSTPINELSVEEFAADQYEYGFVEDLFINFDFAVSVIQRKGLTIREVVLELLNGMSAAVDNYWDFDIIEADKGGLSVVDYKFKGFTTKRDDRPAPPAFISNGTESPFTSFSLTLDVPGAMMNEIIGRRLTGENQASFQTDIGEVPDRLFGSGVVLSDKIALLIDKKNTDTTTSDTNDSLSEEELIRQNFERFQKNATIISNVTSYSGTDFFTKRAGGRNATVSTQVGDINPLDYILVAAWNDSKLLKLVRILNNESTSEVGLTALIQAIKTNFTTFGIGGIRNGFTYRIADLPNKYSDRGLFQVTEVSHTISGMSWTTSVEGQFRQVAEGTYD